MHAGSRYHAGSFGSRLPHDIAKIKLEIYVWDIFLAVYLDDIFKKRMNVFKFTALFKCLVLENFIASSRLETPKISRFGIIEAFTATSFGTSTLAFLICVLKKKQDRKKGSPYF